MTRPILALVLLLLGCGEYHETRVVGCEDYDGCRWQPRNGVCYAEDAPSGFHTLEVKAVPAQPVETRYEGRFMCKPWPKDGPGGSDRNDYAKGAWVCIERP